MAVAVVMGAAIAVLCFFVLLLVSWVLHLLARIEEYAELVRRQNYVMGRTAEEIRERLDTRV